MHCYRNCMKIQQQSFTNVLKSRCSEKFRKFHWKAAALEFLFNEAEGPQPHLQLYLKKTPTQMFSCETCEIFKNTFLYSTPQLAAF